MVFADIYFSFRNVLNQTEIYDSNCEQYFTPVLNVMEKIVILENFNL